MDSEVNNVDEAIPTIKKTSDREEENTVNPDLPVHQDQTYAEEKSDEVESDFFI